MKDFAPFTKCIIHINDDGDGADNFDIIMSMYNLTEYSDNYSDTSGSLLQFRRNESTATDAGNPADVSTVNSTSFKYRSILIQKLISANGNRVFKNVKVAAH